MVAFDPRLYLVTDRALARGRNMVDLVLQAVQGGVTMVQIRDKETAGRDFFQLALMLKKALYDKNVPLIINDRLDIALAVDCDGLHLGQEDIPLEAARRLLGPDKIIGVSVETPEQACLAAAGGADYLGAGPVFNTSTKAVERVIGLGGLAACCACTSLPAVAIGGIDRSNAGQTRAAGAAGIAVVSALLGAPDIYEEAVCLKKVWQES